jgi:2'-5' RNA ligase
MISLDHLEANPRIRYGFYLRPSPEMSRAQAEIHDLLRRQFGIRVGGAFMPHATIMGFHRSDAPLDQLCETWASVAARHAPFTVTNRGVRPHGRSGISLDVHHGPDGASNPAMVALHRDAYASVEPLCHPECEFTRGDWAGDRFAAHLTLAMADIPDFAFDEVIAFVRALEPVGPASFAAEYVHFYAFESDDWGGQWWRSLEWALLHSWRLGGQ